MTLRIVDANLNRIAEGLRVLEELARFILNDAALTEELRSWRHRLREQGKDKESQLLWARDAQGDVGAESPLTGRTDLSSLVNANARRVEESLRVLEEVSQLPDVPWSAQLFRDARFALYTIEKNLYSRLVRREKAAQIAGLYVIIDSQFLKGRDEVAVARQAIQGGARVIQLRDKGRDKGQVLPVAQALQELCSGRGVPFLVNDHLDIALAANADGLHIGQTDLPLPVARRYLPPDKVIGVSTRNREQALRAQAEGADYVAVGSIFATGTKEGAVVRGLEALREVKSAVSIPVVAIGGINHENAAQVVGAGADAVSVISAILGAEDVAQASREMVQRMEAARAIGK